MRKRTRTKSGGCESAVRLRIAWPARLRTYSDTVVGRVTRSGGCQSTVCRADVLAQALPQLLGTLPTGVLAKRLQSRSCNHGGLTPRRSCSGEDAFVQRKSRFFTVERTTCTRSGGREPAVRLPIVWPARLRTYSDTVVGRVTTSGGREPAVFVGNARAGMIRPGSDSIVARSTRSGGREPAVATGTALAKALPPLFGRPSPVSWRTPLQSRSCNHGGLAPPRSWLYTRSRIAKVAFSASSERRAPGAAGVSPAWVGERTCKGSSAVARQTVGPRVGGRRCNRVRVTRGVYVPRSCFPRVRPPTELRLLRCTNAHAPGAAGVSLPWVVRRRTCNAHRIMSAE